MPEVGSVQRTERDVPDGCPRLARDEPKQLEGQDEQPDSGCRQREHGAHSELGRDRLREPEALDVPGHGSDCHSIHGLTIGGASSLLEMRSVSGRQSRPKPPFRGT